MIWHILYRIFYQLCTTVLHLQILNLPTDYNVNLPWAIAVLPSGHASINSPLCATSAPLILLSLMLHHLPLIQGIVEAVIHRLQQQEHGSNHTTVDSHYHHGWR